MKDAEKKKKLLTELGAHPMYSVPNCWKVGETSAFVFSEEMLNSMKYEQLRDYLEEQIIGLREKTLITFDGMLRSVSK